MAAAFDTRFGKPRWLTGSSALRIARRLRRSGWRLVAPPECFLVLYTEGRFGTGRRTRPGTGERRTLEVPRPAVGRAVALRWRRMITALGDGLAASMMHGVADGADGPVATTTAVPMAGRRGRVVREADARLRGSRIAGADGAPRWGPTALPVGATPRASA
jgi:hypothetical protein